MEGCWRVAGEKRRGGWILENGWRELDRDGGMLEGGWRE
jgi:hypothetical protein